MRRGRAPSGPQCTVTGCRWLLHCIPGAGGGRKRSGFPARARTEILCGTQNLGARVGAQNPCFGGGECSTSQRPGGPAVWQSAWLAGWLAGLGRKGPKRNILRQKNISSSKNYFPAGNRKKIFFHKNIFREKIFSMKNISPGNRGKLFHEFLAKKEFTKNILSRKTIFVVKKYLFAIF